MRSEGRTKPSPRRSVRLPRSGSVQPGGYPAAAPAMRMAIPPAAAAEEQSAPSPCPRGTSAGRIAKQQIDARLRSARWIASRCGDLRGGGVEKLLRLPHVQAVGRAAIVTQIDQPQIIVCDPLVCWLISSSRSLLAQREVIVHYVRDQARESRHDAPLQTPDIAPARLRTDAGTGPINRSPRKARGRLACTLAVTGVPGGNGNAPRAELRCEVNDAGSVSAGYKLRARAFRIAREPPAPVRPRSVHRSYVPARSLTNCFSASS